MSKTETKTGADHQAEDQQDKTEMRSLAEQIERLEAVRASGKLTDPLTGLLVSDVLGEANKRLDQVKARIGGRAKQIAELYALRLGDDPTLQSERQRLERHKRIATEAVGWRNTLCDMLRAAGEDDLATRLEGCGDLLSQQSCEDRLTIQKIEVLELPLTPTRHVHAIADCPLKGFGGISHSIQRGETSCLPTSVFGDAIEAAIERGELTEV